MDFSRFTSEKRILSLQQYMTEQGVTVSDCLGLSVNVESIVAYPSGGYMEILDDGRYYLLLERSEYYSDTSKIEDMERELYIWLSTEYSLDDLDISDFIAIVAYQSRANLEKYEYVLDFLGDQFLEMDTGKLNDMIEDHEAVIRRLNDESVSRPFITEVVRVMERVVNEANDESQLNSRSLR